MNGHVRYRASWVSADWNTSEEFDPNLIETDTRIFRSLPDAAQHARRSCILGDPRVYVERYEPFWDEEFNELVPYWTEVGVYYIDPETGELGDLDRLY